MDLKSYLETLMRHQPKFGRASALYAFTTEKLGGYYPALDLKNRSVLTVCGSGDHIINAALFGASKIVGFDINPLALHWAELKVAALKTLDLTEFKQFFLRESINDSGLNQYALNQKGFIKIAYNLSENTFKFFRDLLSVFDNNGVAFRNSAFFNIRYDNNKVKIASNPYLESESNYDKTRENLAQAKIDYLCSSAQDINSKIDDKLFEIIILSNLCDYAPSLYSKAEDPYKSYIDYLCDSLLDILVADGTICAAYLYGQDPNLPPHSTLDIETNRREILKASVFNFKEINFSGIKNNLNDIVVLLNRKEYEQ